VDDQDRQPATGKGFVGIPDRRDERGKEFGQAYCARCRAERCEAGGEDQAVGIDPADDCGDDAGAEREAEQRDGAGRGEAIEQLEGGDCILLKLAPMDAAGAAAIAGVIKHKRRDAGFSEDALNGKPLRGDLADAVTDEHGGSGGLRGGFDVDGVEQAVSAGDGVARYGEVRRVRGLRRDSAGEPIADVDEATGAVQRDGEGWAVGPHGKSAGQRVRWGLQDEVCNGVHGT